MTAPLELSWAKKGECIDVDDIGGHVAPQMVLSSCDMETRGYRCITCNRQLANIGNLMMHLEDGGAHRIVTWCPRHRVFEAAKQSQVDAFAAVQPTLELPS